MGRKAKFTAEERKERKIQGDKKSRKKYKTRKKAESENNPELKKQEMKKQIEANAKYLAKIPQEVKRKKWRIAKRKERASNTKFQKALKTVRLFQPQSLAEQAEMFDYAPPK